MAAKRSLFVIALAVFCVALVVSTPFVAAFPLLPFIVGIIGAFIAGWLVGTFQQPPPGITPADLAQNFYTTKLNEKNAIDMGIKNVNATVGGLGYYFSRKASYAAMQYVNFSTFPQTTVLYRSGVFNETGSEFCAWMAAYQSWFRDLINISRTTFASGEYAGIDVYAEFYDNGAIPPYCRDPVLLDNETDPSQWLVAAAYDFVPPGSVLTVTTNESYIVVGVYGSAYDLGGSFYAHVRLINLQNNAVIEFDAKDSGTLVDLVPGIYQISATNQYNNPMTISVLTNGFIYGQEGWFPWWLGFFRRDYVGSLNTTVTNRGIDYVLARDVAIQCSGAGTERIYHGYIFTDPPTRPAPLSLGKTLLDVIDFAANNAQTYWQTLRGLGYTDPSQIPANMTLPPPDVAFIANEDMLRLTFNEIFAMYLSYLNALKDFINSTTWQLANLTAIMPQNVSFVSPAVKVNCTISRGEQVYAPMSLYYFQVYENLHFVANSTVTLNQSGLVYDTLNGKVYTYQPGDIVTVYDVWVKTPNGDYQRADEATVTSYTVQAYVYESRTSSPSGSQQQQQPQSSLLDRIFDKVDTMLRKYKWYLLGGAIFILLILFAPALNEIGKQWAASWGGSGSRRR
jgi:hypothetical protein